MNALMRIFQLQSRFLRLDGPRLHEKDAGDDLKAVGDTVLHLLQQHILFPQQLLHLFLNGTPVRNVLEGQQCGGMSAGLIEHLARIQEHDAPPNSGEITIDFVSLDRRMILGDRFQNCAKLRDIPLTIVDLVNQMTADILIDEMEGLIEGPARGDDAQVVVEHQKRIANGIDDGMRERGCVWNSTNVHSTDRTACELSASLSNEGNTARIFVKLARTPGRFG